LTSDRLATILAAIPQGHMRIVLMRPAAAGRAGRDMSNMFEVEIQKELS